MQDCRHHVDNVENRQTAAVKHRAKAVMAPATSAATKSPAVKAASRPVPTIKREPKPKSKQQLIMEKLKESIEAAKSKAPAIAKAQQVLQPTDSNSRGGWSWHHHLFTLAITAVAVIIACAAVFMS